MGSDTPNLITRCSMRMTAAHWAECQFISAAELAVPASFGTDILIAVYVEYGALYSSRPEGPV